MEPTEDTQPTASLEDTPPAESDASPSDARTSDETSPNEIDGEPETIADGDTEEEPTPEEREKGYLRDKDYREKTTALANERKQLEAERARLADLARTRDTRLSQADQAIKLAASALRYDFQQVDWNALAQSDPAEYVRKQHEFSQRNAQINEAYQRLQTEQQEKDREEQASRVRRLGEQERALIDAIPEWKDATKRAAETAEIRAFAHKLGATDEALEQISTEGEAWMVQVLRDAMLFRRVKAQLPKPKPTPLAPPPPPVVKTKAPAAKDPERMSTDEWLKWRNADLKRKGLG